MLTGYFTGDGRKWMACPHCERMLEVDIDDMLPVHSTKATLFIDLNVEGSIVPVQQEGPELCAGSWNVKGVNIKFQIWHGGHDPFNKDKGDSEI